MQVDVNAPVFKQNEILIHASPERVWAVLTRIDQWPDWNPNISRAKLEGAARARAKFNWKVNGASIRSVLHTVEYVRSFGWDGHGFGAYAIHNWQLEPEKDGTRVKVSESMNGWLIRLLKKTMNRQLEKDMAFWLEQLKIACEQA